MSGVITLPNGGASVYYRISRAAYGDIIIRVLNADYD
jgi:hypothetical protein